MIKGKSTKASHTKVVTTKTKTKNLRQDKDFLSGGGKIGKIMRSFDWSKTGVGPIDTWPQSLRTAISIVLNSSFPMFIWWGKDELTNFYNDSYAVILGKKHPDALGTSGREAWKEIWKDIGPLANKVLTTGMPVFMKDLPLTVNRHGYDEQTYFTFSYSPIRDEAGNINGLFCACVETTDEVVGRRKLLESEERFRAIADDAPVFIFLAGEDAQVELLNKTWRDYTGISDEESKGRAWAKITHPDDIDPATKIYMDGFNARKSVTFENRQKGTDGIYRTILWKATPRYLPNGQFVGMMGVGLDIDERKRLEQQKDEFIGIASHELKTPITSIKAYTQLLNLRFQKAQDIRSSALVTKMDAQLCKLTNLVNDLLDVTKIEGGKLQFHEAEFDLNELIEEIVEETQRTTSNHKIQMKLGKSQALFGDRDRIGQVVTNFITNAIKYSPLATSLIVRTRATPAKIVVSVQDFGIGIPEDKKEKVFERFYRVEGEKQETFAGMGIGLYVSREIISRHGGEVWIDSEVGAGSTFYFSLPINKTKSKQ